MNRTAYIAGNITTQPKTQAADKFNTVATQLTDLGYNVVKPIALHTTTTDPTTTRSDIQLMLNCDEVHLLPDWQQCRTARLKRDIALRVGMELVYH